MDREDFYYRQPVTETELNQAFTYAENAMFAMMGDQGLFGIFQGGGCGQHTPVANLSIDVGGPFYAYDELGERIFSPVGITVDCAQDSQAVSTNVVGSGNEKWVSVALRFKRVLSDPRIDGNSISIYFQHAESYEVVITQAAEAVVGSGAKPPLDPNSILLCDIHRTYGQTQILAGDISIARRQDTYVFTGPPGGLSIRAGTPKGAVEAMLDALNTHILSLGSGHSAASITSAASPSWWDGYHLDAGGSTQAYLDWIVSLEAQTIVENLGFVPILK